MSFTTCTTTGARYENEDYEWACNTTDYSITMILDGHSKAERMKNYLGDLIKTKILKLLEQAVNDDVELFVTELKQLYYRCLDELDKQFFNGGTTLSLGIFDKINKKLYTIQVGDSIIFVADTNTNSIANAVKIYVDDDLIMDHDIGYMPCITNIHDFTDQEHIDTFTNICSKHKISFRTSKRTDTTAIENRYVGYVNGQDIPEPSRTIETKSFYSGKLNLDFLKQTHRTPEITAWSFDTTNDLLLVGVCDGFGAKLAIPTNDLLAELIVNPGSYMNKTNILENTLIGSWIETKPWWNNTTLVKPTDEDWKLTPLLHANKLVYHIAPDSTWRNAVKLAYNTIDKIINEHTLDELVSTSNLQVCAELSINIAVSLASDDNVSIAMVLL